MAAELAMELASGWRNLRLANVTSRGSRHTIWAKGGGGNYVFRREILSEERSRMADRRKRDRDSSFDWRPRGDGFRLAWHEGTASKRETTRE